MCWTALPHALNMNLKSEKHLLTYSRRLLGRIFAPDNPAKAGRGRVKKRPRPATVAAAAAAAGYGRGRAMYEMPFVGFGR